MDYREAAAFLRAHDNYLILTHKRPDGDTIGCAVGLCALLRQIGKTAWLHPNEDATELFTPYLEGYIAPADFAFDKVVAVDVATLDLLTDGERAIADSRGVDLCIDHHPSNTGYAAANCVEADKAACGEIIYKLVGELGELDGEIAKMLYVAVSTDTGCFAYANTTAGTHRVAAALMETGIDYRTVNKVFFRTKTRKRMQLEGAMLSACEFYDQGRVAVLSVPLSLMERFQATESDAEDLSALGPQIQGVDCAITLRELREDVWKISLRTGERINATRACGLLGGGGHAAAAGCTVEAPWAEVKRRILDAVAQTAPDFSAN